MKWLALVLVPGIALAADPAERMPIYYFEQPSTVMYKDILLDMPPGYFLAEPTFQVLDLEVQRLQRTEVKLKAENASLRESVSLPVVAVIVASALGVVAGGAAVYFLVPR